MEPVGGQVQHVASLQPAPGYSTQYTVHNTHLICVACLYSGYKSRSGCRGSIEIQGTGGPSTGSVVHCPVSRSSLHSTVQYSAVQYSIWTLKYVQCAQTSSPSYNIILYMTIRVKQCLQMPNLWQLLIVYAPLRIPHASPRKVNAPLRKVNAPLGKVNAPLRKVNAPLRKVNVLCSEK